MKLQKHRWFALLLSLPLIACQPSKANEEARATPRPSKSDLEKALNAHYVASAASRPECLGRLTFNVSGAFKWALSAPTRWDSKGQEPVLSWELRSGDETLQYGDYVTALIFPGATQEQFDEDYQRTVDKQIYLKQDLLARIQADEQRLQKSNHADTSKSASNNTQDEIDPYIVEIKEGIAEKKRMLSTLNVGVHPMDFGMADRRGYALGRSLSGYILSQGVYYRFEMGDIPADRKRPAIPS